MIVHHIIVIITYLKICFLLKRLKGVAIANTFIDYNNRFMYILNVNILNNRIIYLTSLYDSIRTTLDTTHKVHPKHTSIIKVFDRLLLANLNKNLHLLTNKDKKTIILFLLDYKLRRSLSSKYDKLNGLEYFKEEYRDLNIKELYNKAKNNESIFIIE